MGWLDDIEHALGRFNDQVREAKAFGADPRHLQEDDRAAWQRSESIRNSQPPKSRAQIIASISAARPVRYARLRRDMKWLEKQAAKHGLSPQDARWLV